MSDQRIANAFPNGGAMQPGTELTVPDSLRHQLLAFRKRVWMIKAMEAIAVVTTGFAVAFLSVYIVDRWGGMPWTLRLATLCAAIALTLLLPWFGYHWVWKLRGLEPLARLLGKRLPAVGDQLLGVVELTHSRSEQARSLALCQAAMRQVAEDAQGRDFSQATPPCHHRIWASAAAVMLVAVAGVAFSYPAASANALARLVAPWKDIPRYTFTRISPLPEKLVVAHGEPVALRIGLLDESRWQPAEGELSFAQQPPVTARLRDGQYTFAVPPQINTQMVTLRIGDVVQPLALVPTLRPELSSLIAEVHLPAYLGQPSARQVDSRAGAVSMVRGSEAVITATANRPLAAGQINGEPREPDGASLASGKVGVESATTLRFTWRDHLGLEGREPFALAVTSIDDEAPTLLCEGLPRQAVMLDSEMLKFRVRASDDFGIRRVGIMWRGLSSEADADAAGSERPLAAGGHDAGEVEVIGTFSAKSLGIEPQPIELFVWTEDYLPGRARVYSPPHVLYILTPDQHAIWMAEQLSKWHRQALDVRDTERQLHQTNQELRALPVDELNLTDNRQRIQRQASAELANGRRLSRLGELGDELIRTASRNPEIGVGHLERWAEMLQVLKDLSENRMPSVAALLTETSEGPASLAGSPPNKDGPMVGQTRESQTGDSPAPETASARLRSAPKLADGESSMNSPDDEPIAPGSPKKPSSPALRLPVTTVTGKRTSSTDPPRADQQASLQQAVEEQADLLAEFDRLADELNTVLANLEGSTLVKRLKAASREQDLVAGQLTRQLQPAFGVSKSRLTEPVRSVLDQLKETEESHTQKISHIMDDLAAYFERRRFMQFKVVLDEMKSTDVIGGLRQLAEEIPSQQGLSIAQCEFWSDTMDRWAENLVDPACSGTCPGGKSPESLPPSIVLEVLQILEAEVNLREETRVAQQAMAAVEQEKHLATAEGLSATQTEIKDRVVKVIARIEELPDSQTHFGKELAMLGEVDRVMQDATNILRRPETGAPAIAAETEAIELLLRSKRINPRGGGSSGSSPGGGGSGQTTDSALALIGKGTNPKEVREDRSVMQTTGETGAVLPEEFRRGLDQYFNQLGGS